YVQNQKEGTSLRSVPVRYNGFLMPQVKDLLNNRVAHTFVGRAEELALLLQTVEPDGPLVVHLHGIAGSGKTTLLDVFTQRARSTGATIVRFDCRNIEPTEAGFVAELVAAIGSVPGTPEEIAIRLGQVGTRVVLVLDTYEVFRLMDTWLRQVFVPLLPDNVRLVLSGREGPVTAWFSAPGWHGLFKAVRLDSLDAQSALEYLSRAGVPAEEAKTLEGICHGLPLALTLAASLQGSAGTMAVTASVGQRIIEELSRLYISDVTDPQTRRVLEAASVVRRATVPLLGAMLPDASPQDAHERIWALPFVHAEKDGLHIHDAVREALALTLRAQNPNEYRAHRRAAYHHFMSALRTAAKPDLWRCIADLLYLLENPVIREAFFPTGSQEYAVEPAQPQDDAAITQIIGDHEGPAMSRSLIQWWKRAPETFVVVRDRKGAVAGFYCALDPAVHPRLNPEDPIVRAWIGHLDQEPLPRQQCALFLRRWLSAKDGEVPSAVQAACWIDLKRKYLEMRPHGRRVYITVRDLAPYTAVAQKLGFQVLLDRSVPIDGGSYSTGMLDFGPASVDGWLARLVATELEIQNDGLLDAAARELVVNGRRVSLTKLEFGVMEYLEQQSGKAVPRIALLENVWEQHYDGGSNVVDVVIRSLRKKLGDRASMIETVQGVGYRLRRET
ncbi:MAG TPA: winged helix-turn-helix domain-containing protein, partial [Gemmatimonadaceae bacterium]|nr:winged helix-turn-helix domain-containing protein [Gemmatimonadaceae bacterium]